MSLLVLWSLSTVQWAGKRQNIFLAYFACFYQGN